MTDFLASILEFITRIVQNNGWSIVIFTLLIRFVLMPLDVKSRKSMKKMAKVQPEMERLQKKYQNDKQKLNLKVSELYKKEKVSPLSGCIPMLIQWPILIWMFAAMRAIANEHMVAQVFSMLSGQEPVAAADTWLWIKNIYSSDSFFASVVPGATDLSMIGQNVWLKVYNEWVANGQWANVQASLSGVVNFETTEAAKETISMILSAVEQTPLYLQYTETLPGWHNQRILFFTISLYVQYNGYLVLPVLAVVSQVLMNKLNPQTNGANQNNAANSTAGSTTKFMQIFFPFLSFYFCLSSNAGFAIYWVTSNIVMGVQSVAINKWLDKKENQALQGGNQ